MKDCSWEKSIRIHKNLLQPVNTWSTAPCLHLPDWKTRQLLPNTRHSYWSISPSRDLWLQPDIKKHLLEHSQPESPNQAVCCSTQSSFKSTSNSTLLPKSSRLKSQAVAVSHNQEASSGASPLPKIFQTEEPGSLLFHTSPAPSGAPSPA